MNRRERRLLARGKHPGLWLPSSAVPVRVGPDPTPGVMVTLGYSDLHGKTPTREELVALVTSCTSENLLWKVSALGTLLALQGRATSLTVQAQLTMQLLPEPLNRRAVERLTKGEHQILVHHEGLIVTALLALAHGQAGTGGVQGDRDPFTLGRILLMVNDLLAEGPKDWTIDDALHFALRNDVFGTNDQPRYVLARYYDLLGVRARRPGSPRVNFDAAFTAATGLELDDYWALSLGHFGLFARLQKAGDIDSSHYGRVLLEPTAEGKPIFDKYLTITSRPIAVARDSLRADPPVSLAYADIQPFLRAPLIQLTTGAQVPVWLSWYVDKMASGPRWILQDFFAAQSSRGVQDFNAYLGELWENYVRDLLARCYPSSGPLQILFGPIVYGKPPEESNDATLFLGDAAVFIEATVTAPQARILWTGNSTAYRSFVRERLVMGRPGKLAKLARRINDFRSGALHFPGVEPSQIRHIIPVLATLTPHPRNPITATVVREEAAGLLSQREYGAQQTVYPIGVIAAEELEIVESASRAGGFDLALELRNWSESPYRDWPLKNYLFDRGVGRQPNPYLAQRFDEFTHRGIDSLRRLIVIGS